MGEEEEGRASSPARPLRPLQALRSPPLPSGSSGAAPPPAWPAQIGGHPLDPRLAVIAGGLEVCTNPGSRRRGGQETERKVGNEAAICNRRGK